MVYSIVKKALSFAASDIVEYNSVNRFTGALVQLDVPCDKDCLLTHSLLTELPAQLPAQITVAIMYLNASDRRKTSSRRIANADRTTSTTGAASQRHQSADTAAADSCARWPHGFEQ